MFTIKFHDFVCKLFFTVYFQFQTLQCATFSLSIFAPCNFVYLFPLVKIVKQMACKH